MSVLNAKAQQVEGDTLKFWSVSYVDWPPLWGSPQRQFDAVCEKAGDHCYVFVEVGATMPSQTNIDNLVTAFDTHFYPELTAKYGPVPDALDNDSNVFIVVLNESDWAGYYDPGQQMTDSMVMATWNRHSTEREIIYVAAGSFYGAQGICAHEFGHLCHWEQDHSPEASMPGIYWESAFVDEGFSTFAAEYLTENLYQHNVYDNSAFFQYETDIPLIYFSNYDQAQLFMTFMFEQYGEWDYITALIQNQLNSWQGVDSTLRLLGYSETFDDVFEQWCIANYADDSVYMGGKYAYRHFRFPDALLSATHNNYPIFTQSGDLRAYSCHYVKFSSPSVHSLEIQFNSDASYKFRLAFLELNATGNALHKVHSVIPNASGSAVFNTDSLGLSFNELVMVVMSTDPSLDTNDFAHYTYQANSTEGLNEISAKNQPTIYPNPAQDQLFLDWSEGKGEKGVLEIYDSAGNRVMVSNFTKKTKSINIQNLNAGTYSMIIRFDERVVMARFVKQ